jgi:hypothetical protein
LLYHRHELPALAILVFLLAGCASAPPSPSNDATSEPISAPLKLCPPVDSLPKDLVNLAGYTQFRAIVSSATRDPLTDLKQTDFTAYSDTQTFSIRYFQQNKADVPVSIAIIVDESGSMATKLGATAEKAKPSFIEPNSQEVAGKTRIEGVQDSLGKAFTRLNACDEIAILTFGGQTQQERINAANSRHPEGYRGETKVRIIQPLTTDHALALSRLNGVTPEGQTPLYDAIHEGLNVLKGAHYPNRALIVITDGMDTTSFVTKQTLHSEIARSRVPIYATGIGDPNAKEGDVSISIGPFVVGHPDDAKVDAESLKSIATESGGRAFIVSPIAIDSGNKLINATATIVSMKPASYSIGLVLQPGVDVSSIRFAVNTKPDALVHASIVGTAATLR